MEQDEKVLANLKVKVQLAGILREMAQTPGFTWLKAELNKRITDLRNEWLTADEEKAAKIKARASAYNEIFEVLKSHILVGDQAAQAINQYEEENKIS